MKLRKSIVIGIVTIVLSSCSALTNSTEQPSRSTPIINSDAEIGEFLEITAPNGWNLFKADDVISLEIRNISDHQISFGPDFGARIFVWSGKGWIEVENKERYQYELITLEPTENYDPLKTAGTFVLPDLPDYSVKSDIRIYLFGDMIENDKEVKKVASYIDLNLNP